MWLRFGVPVDPGDDGYHSEGTNDAQPFVSMTDAMPDCRWLRTGPFRRRFPAPGLAPFVYGEVCLRIARVSVPFEW